MTTIAKRVAAGAAFLDEHEAGWDLDINLDKPDIGSTCNCILGQLHGSFSGGLMAHRFATRPLNWDTDLGFMWDLSLGASKNEPADLTAEWKRVITERQAAS